MAINFPATAGQPTDGSFTHSEAGVAYFWDGDSWVADGRNVTPQTDLTALSVTTNPAGNSALSYNNTTGVFSYTPPQLTVSSLTDVSFSVIENGWALTYSNGNWTASGVPSELGELTNVAATAPNNGDVLTWNAPNARWQPAAVSGGGSSGGASVTVSDTAPGSGTAGDLWWNSDSGRLKIYYQDTDSTQWVDASPPRSFADSQVQSDWAETDSNNVAFIENKPTLFSGSYNDLTDQPTLFSGSYNDLTNQPTLFSGSYSDLSNKPTIPNTGIVSVKEYGAVGNGSTDDTSAIQLALNSTAKAIYFPTGEYVISSALTSSLNGRKIYGEGTITTTATALANEGVVSLEKAFVFTDAEYVDFSLDCDGNNLIEIFAQFNQCLDPHIHHCRVRDLESPAYPTGGKAIAFELFNQGANAVDTGAKITDNYITNLIAHDDDGGVVGRGMARGIAFDTDITLNKPILIADNVIDTVAGNEGDAISVMSVSGSNYLNANVFITGNHIKDFNRRGCKIKFNSAVISNNTFYNTWTSSPVNSEGVSVVQGVVDLVNGEKHIVSGNKFINTEYMSQIKIVTSGSETVSNCVIKDNVITQISGATSSSLMYFSSSTSTDANLQGTNLTIKDNSFDVPGFSDYCIRVVRTKNVIIADNTGIINSSATGVHVPGSAANNNLINVNNNFLVAT
jgi:hypothetical protein